MQSKASGAAAARSVGADSGRFRHWGLLLLGGGLLWIASPPGWSADDYLSELDSEASKVEAREIESAEREETAAAPSTQATVVPHAPVRSIDRAGFEGLLKQHYLGTYRFYKKLPERSREEIFDQYRSGADIGVIRSKIVTRLLQQ